MIFVIRQSEILQCCELYANIERNTLPTLNPQPILHRLQYYHQAHYSHTFHATNDTFALTQLQQNLFESNTFSFTQLLSAPYSTNFLDSQLFDATKDQSHPYLSTPVVKPTSLTQPNEPKFTVELDLPNEELDTFSEDEDKLLHNQIQEEDDEEEVESVSTITIVPPYYIPPNMQNFEESNFQDSEYSHSLDSKKVQHLVGTLFEGM